MSKHNKSFFKSSDLVLQKLFVDECISQRLNAFQRQVSADHGDLVSDKPNLEAE